MNNQSKLNPFWNEDMAQFSKMMGLIKAGWRWIVAGSLLGGLLAAAYLWITPKQYEAQALFLGAKVQGVELESAALLQERIKFASFYGPEDYARCGLGDQTGDSQGELLARSVQTMVVKGTDTLLLSYKAQSRQLAEDCLSTVVNKLINFQNKTLEISLLSAKKQLESAQAQLKQMEQRSAFDKQPTAAGTSDAKFNQLVWQLFEMSRKGEVESLRSTIFSQILAQAEPLTRPASLVAPIHSSNNPVFPKKLRVLLIGILGGFLVGGSSFFVLRYKRPKAA